MIVTDHEKIYHRPFRKDFYTAGAEIAHMIDLGKSITLSYSFVEVAAYREELDGIKVVGKRCSRPIKVWSQCITSD